MNLRTISFLAITHISIGLAGFAAGIYLLPILIAPPAPSDAVVQDISSKAQYNGQFVKDLQDSDALHWGEGTFSVSHESISLMGKLAPGPDYKLYLSPKFVETEAAFEDLKSSMKLVGDIKTFNNFVIDLPPSTQTDDFTTVIIWCETFGEFITAGKYR